MEDKIKELLDLYCEASDTIIKAERAFIDAKKEYSKKITEFFESHKHEIAMNASAFNEKKYFNGHKSVESLITEIKVSGWNGGFFLSDKFGNKIRLDPDVINQISFLDDDSIKLYNEVNADDTYPEEYRRLITDGKYAVIIYPTDTSHLYSGSNVKNMHPDDFSIYIGKTSTRNNYWEKGNLYMKHGYQSGKGQFQIYPNSVFDSVVFKDANAFNDYVSRHGYHNDMKLSSKELKELPK